MGMGFETCVSGLSGCSKALEVTSNNIANANTVGFKTAQAQFADVYSATLAAGMTSSQSAGLGTSVPQVTQSFLQGVIRQTGQPLDMAINGDGFFRLANEAGGISYSRNGEFQLEGVPFAAGTVPTAQQLIDQQLQIVNGSGLHLTGYLASFATDPMGTITATGTPQNIVIDSSMPGAATTGIDLALNLDAGAVPPATTPFNPADSSTYNYMTQVDAYGAGGTAHDLMLGFVKQDPASANAWEMHAMDSGRAAGDVDLGTLTLPMAVAAADQQFTIAVDGGAAVAATLSATSYASLDDLVKGVQAAIDDAVGPGKASVALDANNHLVVTSDSFGTSSTVAITGGTGYFGSVTSSTGHDLISTLTFDTSGQLDAASQTRTLDFGDGTPVTLDLGNTTQYAGSNSVNAESQNGNPPGHFLSLSVGSTGIVEAHYSNGLSRNAAQLVLADFNNPEGLISIGDNQWVGALAAGAEILDTPGSRNVATAMGMGTIHGGALEEANVDLNFELVNLIIQQRNYQANAQAVKTRDQMLQTLSNMKG